MKIKNIFLTALLASLPVLSSASLAEGVKVTHGENEINSIALEKKARFIIIPVEVGAPIARFEVTCDASGITSGVDVPLARTKIDHYVTINIEHGKLGEEAIKLNNAPKDAIGWKNISLSDNYDPALDEAYRPIYHHTAFHGWMNDPNGMFYKDGRYHLYYQYNPWATIWGNMHWGHSSTSNFIDWRNEGIAIAPDHLGTIFSGSCIIDKKNAAGYGKDAIIAYYTSTTTSAQTQSMAFSTDNGRTFTKNEKNPILTSTKGDFRDPKVIYHEASDSYIMVLAVGRNIEFYSSQNLKDWSFASQFGEDDFPAKVIRECPDFFPMKDAEGKEKWVLISNNEGLPNEGIGSQYFIGDFDGKQFTSENKKDVGKWFDYGQDNYAGVTWSNAPDGRIVYIGWMNSWRYANGTPTEMFRSANTIPRDLYLFEQDGEDYIGSRPSPEFVAMRQESEAISQACEINFTLTPQNEEKCSFSLQNDKGEKVNFTLDIKEKTVSVDRQESGPVHYLNPPAAPLLGEGYNFRLFIDKGSVECLINDGKTVISSAVYPSKPFNKLVIEPSEGSINNTKIYSYSR